MSEVAYGATAQEEELDSLLNSHTGHQPSRDDGWDINEPIKPDTSQVNNREKWPEGIYPVRSTALTGKMTQHTEKMGVLTFTCKAGPLKGQTRDENLMLEGRGLGKTCVYLAAVDLYDPAKKEILWRSPADMLDRDCWIVVQHVKATSKRGTEFINDEIPFRDGFLPFLGENGKPRFDMPDLFSEPGQVEAPSASVPAVQASAPAPPVEVKAAATPPVVSSSTEPAPNWT